MKKDKVKTSVIGSYPVEINTLELAYKYFKKEKISWKKYISSAVDDMLNAGVDIVSDGQTKDPFITIFTRKLDGCRVRDRTEIIDKIRFTDPITVEDQAYVKSILPENKSLLGLIAGPYTITKSCINRYYGDEKEAAFDFADALNKEAKLLQEHVDMISIDEPFFSNNMPDYAVELIEKLLDGISCQVRIHICGDVSNIIPEILDIPIDVLSHEFKASPKLLDSFEEYADGISKKICLGSVRSDVRRIETVEEIVEHIKKARGVFEEKITQISPDCGLRSLTRDVAFKKLKNLVKAGEIAYGR